MKSGIYCWTSPSGKKYIGQSTNLKKRKFEFLTFNYKYGGMKIEHARKKYSNKSLWSYEVLEYCEVDKLDQQEVFWIWFYDTIKYGYNIESGGGLNKHFKMTEEQKKKISDSHKGRPAKNRKKVSQYTKDNVLLSSYISLQDAESKTGVSFKRISACCRGICKTAGNFIWKYE